MKKILSVIVFIFFFSAGTKVQAQIINAQTFEKLVIETQTKDLLAKGHKEVEVKVINVPLKTIQLADGKITLKINSNQTDINSREYKKIDIYVNGNYERSIGIPVEVKVYETVMVAKNTIFKDNLLTSKNIEFKRCDIAATMQKPLLIQDQSQEMLATKVYKPGEIIDKRFCKIRPDIARNANVTVIFKTSNDLSISVDGIAISEGNIGSMVSVENKTYKKVYMGRVIGTNKILVEI